MNLDDTDHEVLFGTSNLRTKLKTVNNLECSTENPRTVKRFKQVVPSQDQSKGIFTPTTDVWGSSGSRQQPNKRPDPLNETHFSALTGAHDFVSIGATYNNIQGNYIVTPKATDEGTVYGPLTLGHEDISPQRQIYKGLEYRIHSALNQRSGKVVAMKIYEGSRAKERWLEAIKFMAKLMHPNVAHVIAVSPLNAANPFLIVDGEYEGPADRMLSQVLKKDLKECLTLGLQTVIGLSSGLDYLQDSEYPFELVGPDHFVILSCKEKVVIWFNAEELGQVSHSDQDPYRYSITGRAQVLFHELCQKTFDGASKAHYGHLIQRTSPDEFDTAENHHEELDGGPYSSISPASPWTAMGFQASSRRLPGCRLELVWKSQTAESLTLENISRQFQGLLYSHRSSSKPVLNHRRGRYTSSTPHRCPEYRRIEITLTTNITRSAIVSHSSPTPGEICPVCKEIVRKETFSCRCRGNDDESIPNVRCSDCSMWSHRLCVGYSDSDNHKFVCVYCFVNVQDVPFPALGSPFLDNGGARTSGPDLYTRLLTLLLCSLMVGILYGARNVNITSGSFKTVNGPYHHNKFVTHQHNVHSNNILGNTNKDGTKFATQNGRSRQNTAAAGQKTEQRCDKTDPRPHIGISLFSRSNTAPATHAPDPVPAFGVSPTTQAEQGALVNLKEGNVQNISTPSPPSHRLTHTHVSDIPPATILPLLMVFFSTSLFFLTMILFVFQGRILGCQVSSIIISSR